MGLDSGHKTTFTRSWRSSGNVASVLPGYHQWSKYFSPSYEHMKFDMQIHCHISYPNAHFIATAPTPPRRVSAELITPVVIKVTWSRPSVTRGATLVFYTVYAIPFVSQVSPSLTRGKRQVENQRLDTVAKVRQVRVLQQSVATMAVLTASTMLISMTTEQLYLRRDTLHTSNVGC